MSVCSFRNLITPTTPSLSALVVVSVSEIDLYWTFSAGAVQVQVYRSTDNVTFSLLPAGTLAGNVTAFRDTTCSALTQYWYRVLVTSFDGLTATSNTQTGTTPSGSPPNPASGLTAHAFNSSRIDLAWTNNGGSPTGFKIKRSTDSGVTFPTEIDVGVTTAYTDTGLAPSTRYDYEVIATNANGDAAASNVAHDTTFAGGTPTLPSFVHAFPNINVMGVSWGSLDSYMISLLGGAPVFGYTNGVDGTFGSNSGGAATFASQLALNPNLSINQYANISNTYLLFYLDWLATARAGGFDEEGAFYHSGATHVVSGANGNSTVPPDVFWYITRYLANGTITDKFIDGTQFGQPVPAYANRDPVTPAMPAVTFGTHVGDYIILAHPEKFRELNITLSTVAVSPFAFAVDYADTVDGSGNITHWTPFTPAADTTSGLTASGKITFDDGSHLTNPPAATPAWVPCDLSVGGGNWWKTSVYAIRVRTTNAGGTVPIASSIKTHDYIGSSPTGGTLKVFDYTADTDHDGYLNPTQYALRASGKDAYFAYEGRLIIDNYGMTRYAQHQSNAHARAWVVDVQTRLMNFYSLAKALFLDNEGYAASDFLSWTLNTATWLDGALHDDNADMANIGTDSGTLRTALWASIYSAGNPRYLLPNISGSLVTQTAPYVQACQTLWNESVVRPALFGYTNVDGFIADCATRFGYSPPCHMMVLDVSPLTAYANSGVFSAGITGSGGSTYLATYGARWHLGGLALVYLAAKPPYTWIAWQVGGNPARTWGNDGVQGDGHWSNAVSVNIGVPTGVATDGGVLDEATAVAAAPSASTSTSGGSIPASASNPGASPWLWKATYGDQNCETQPSPASSPGIVTTGSTSTLTFQSPPASGLTPGWFIYVSNGDGNFWRQGGPYAVGSPVTLTSLTIGSGTKPPTILPQRKLYARDFSLGYVLYMPVAEKLGTQRGTMADVSALPYTLPGSYRPINDDGSIGSAVSSGTIRGGEGLLFLK